MSAPEQSVQSEPAGQDAQHPAQQALAALAEGGVAFDVQALLRSAPASPLNKEAAVLILFGVLDNSPSTGKFDGCPENVSADLDVLLLVRAATLRSHAGQPAFPGGKIDPEDYALAETTGEPVAHIAALDYLAGGQEMAEHVFNVGTGQGASVREVVSKVIASTGLDLEPEELARRAGDPPQLIGNATRIGEVLGWKAEHDLDDIVDSSYTSWQADPNRPHFG